MSKYQQARSGPNLNSLNRLVLILFFASIPLTHAVTIDPTDKTILTNWLSTWKYPANGFVFNLDSTVCADLVRLKDATNTPGIICDSNGRVKAIALDNALWGSTVREVLPAQVPLPDTLAQLVRLERLKVRGVLLRGTIPANLATLPLLTELDLGVNNLWGEVPVELATQKSNLAKLNLADNLISGTFPDMSGHKNLSFFSMSSNLLRCPQPYLKPSFFSVENFPALFVDNCFLQINLLADQSSPFSMCGEITNSSTRCNYFPQVYPNISLAEFPKFVAEPEGIPALMEVSNGRSTFRYKNSSGIIIPDFRIQVEIHSITSFRLPTISIAPLSDVFRFTSYHTMLTEKTATGYRYRLQANLNGTRGKFESIWEFSQGAKIKFSFALSDWDFPYADSGLSIEYQGNFISPYATKDSPSVCVLGPQDLLQTFFVTGSFDITMLNCTGTHSTFTSNTYKKDDELFPGLLQNMKFEKHGILVEFPGEYIRDGVADHFDPQSPTFFLWPFGKVPVMNYRDEPSFIYNAVIDQLLDAGVEQAGIINVRLVLKRFNDMLYDPTMLPSLFESPPGDPNNATVNVAAIAAGIVVAVIVVSLILALIFIPKFRRVVLPFSQARARSGAAAAAREEARSTQLDLELTQNMQETPTSSPPATPKRWTIADRPTSYQPDDL